MLKLVSTHSRPKAAGRLPAPQSRVQSFQLTAARRRLASKPVAVTLCTNCFNSQPPEGGWNFGVAAGQCQHGFNSQPPEGGWTPNRFAVSGINCFNSQPPEGGWFSRKDYPQHPRCFNSQPPEGGWAIRGGKRRKEREFQLTAARRRLVPPLKPLARKACIALFR